MIHLNFLFSDIFHFNFHHITITSNTCNKKNIHKIHPSVNSNRFHILRIHNRTNNSFLGITKILLLLLITGELTFSPFNQHSTFSHFRPPSNVHCSLGFQAKFRVMVEENAATGARLDGELERARGECATLRGELRDVRGALPVVLNNNNGAGNNNGGNTSNNNAANNGGSPGQEGGDSQQQQSQEEGKRLSAGSSPVEKRSSASDKSASPIDKRTSPVDRKERTSPIDRRASPIGLSFCNLNFSYFRLFLSFLYFYIDETSLEKEDQFYNFHYI